MENLDDKTLLDVYHQAVEYDLDKDFIFIIVKELKERGLLPVNQKSLKDIKRPF
ncbi:MAG TPA: sporulation histidine kinase inhibitor Sda [Metabacillus sp.]|nr:sporulation histidine kinase inhibitor Sda [Metabacillus sp.]